MVYQQRNCQIKQVVTEKYFIRRLLIGLESKYAI